MFVDTHCHIQEKDYPLGGESALARAHTAGVEKLICVGTDEHTSAEAVAFAAQHENVWASVGLHPHDAKHGMNAVKDLESLLNEAPALSREWEGAGPDLKAPPTSKIAEAISRRGVPSFRPPTARIDRESTDVTNFIVAIGECGLDYFYDNSPREQQFDMLHAQLELARDHNLPVIFHVREAFDDFWPIFKQYSGIRGVLHSFTDTTQNMETALAHGLYIGVNGISTFTKVDAQKEMFARIPLEHLLLETDAPFLTPVPKRGSINEPAYVKFVAEHVAHIKNTSIEEVARVTTANATNLFSL